MLNHLWAFLLLFGILAAAFTGNLEAVSNGILDSAQEAVDLLLVMSGIIAMWNGILAIAEGSGLTAGLTKKMRPLLKFLFPKLPPSHPAGNYICVNFIANLLGLGWACTPTGLAAMKELQNLETERGNPTHVASGEMCTFLILNISSLQLVPMNMIAYRSKYGSTAPLAVIAPALIATTLTTLLAILLCKLFTSASDHFR